MALWNALGPAATVAQLVGVDAAGLVSATLHAVRTARRNRKECRSLARRVMMVGDLLQLLRQGSSETMRRAEVRRALDGLGDALQRAYQLVESCQDGSSVYGFVMAGRQAEQFRDVQGEIDSYLLVFPMVTHIDITIRLDRIYNMLLPSDHSHQGLEPVLSSPTSHVEPYARNEGSDLGGRNQRSLTETCEVEEHQGTGIRGPEVESIFDKLDLQEIFKEHLTGDQRLKWFCWLPQRNVEAYDLLKAATSNFSSRKKIGSGGWSIVYKAHIGGLEVAIKRYPTYATSHASDGEVEILKKLQHKNIIKLLGHCTGRGERIYVFEYMSNGTLDKFVFDARHRASVDWRSRFHIMEGIAQGLVYLHIHDHCIVHKDLKPSNILLDSDMNPKISDFGIATTLCTGFSYERSLCGTFGYMAPEYLREGILSPKVDVYAYGVILLEVISGRRSSVRCHQHDERRTLTEDAWNLWEAMRLSEFLDPLLRNGDQITEIIRCIQIALLCVQAYPADRPSMSDVLLMLGDKMTIPSPKLPPWHQTDDQEYDTDDQEYDAEAYASEATNGHEYNAHGYAGEATNGHEYNAHGYASEATWSSSDITWPR